MHKRYLKDHGKIHKSFDEIPKFKCNECGYITKLKVYLKQHETIHQDGKFKCLECSFVRRRKPILNNHFLTQKRLGVNIQM